jgi:hypothetical protein
MFVGRYGNGNGPAISHGPRLSTHQPHVAIPRTKAGGRPHRDLLRFARLRSKCNTRIYGRSLSLFKTHHGEGTGERDGQAQLPDLHADRLRPRWTRLLPARLDHPKNPERLAVFDVIPILETWSRSDARFAQTYWPLVLLSQKEPRFALWLQLALVDPGPKTAQFAYARSKALLQSQTAKLVSGLEPCQSFFRRLLVTRFGDSVVSSRTVATW